jgi:hypothetical protein
MIYNIYYKYKQQMMYHSKLPGIPMPVSYTSQHIHTNYLKVMHETDEG